MLGERGGRGGRRGRERDKREVRGRWDGMKGWERAVGGEGGEEEEAVVTE